MELRLPDLELLDELASLAAKGIHPPETTPFGAAWTDLPSPELERSAVRWNLLQMGGWRTDAWSFDPVVLHAGSVVGTQGIAADNFSVTRSFRTGSWLGREHQGRGMGREMRSAILHFGFVCLAARVAESTAFLDNQASLGVSRSLGYEENGRSVVARRGLPAEQVAMRLTRAQWELSEPPGVQVEGVEHCLDLFGA